MKKRRGSCLPAVLLALVLLAAVTFVLLRFVFVVRKVEVSGSVNISSEEVIRKAHIAFGESIFNIDEVEICRAINATGDICCEGVERDYPNTLILRVRQRKAAAMAFHGGKLVILDESGCAMQSLENAPDSDLVFASDFDVTSYTIGEVVSADERQLKDFCAVVQAVRRQGAAAYVSELKLTNENDLRIITRRGIEVKLGNGDNMDSKIAWLKSAAADLENRGQSGGILDVSSGTKADYRASEN